jgi:hypothetical protein
MAEFPFTELFRATGYLPHVGQARFHASDARFKLLIAGARFGKSLAGTKDLLAELLAGQTRGWLVAPTYALALPEFRYFLDDFAALRLHEATIRDGGRNNHSMAVTPWGAQVYCLSATLPHTLLGQEIDWLLLCEAAHLASDVYPRYLRARLATRTGRLVVPTTPRGRNWLHELYERGLGADPDWQSFRFATWDNPRIAAHEIEAARATLPPETFDEQYGGAFTVRAGRVYPEFAPALHVVQGLRAPAGGLVYRALDFGYRNPFCCLWAVLDHDDRLLILREHYAAGVSATVHAGLIREIDDEFRARGLEPGPAFADPAGLTERAILRDAGLHTRGARNDVRGGIELVRSKLLTRGDGTPGLMVDAGCIELIREFESYVWDDDGSRPVKRDDHALDALRYLCMALHQQRGRGTPVVYTAG